MKTDPKPKLPGIVLRNWTDKENSCVLKLQIFLTVDCEIVGVVLEAEKGCETKAAIASFKLGVLALQDERPGLPK